MPVERFQAPNSGADYRTPPASIAKNRAQIVDNFLTHQPGKLVARGGMARRDALFGTFEFDNRGYFVVNNEVLFCRKSGATRQARYFDGTSSSAVVIAADNLLPTINSVQVGGNAYAPGLNNTILRWNGGAIPPVAMANSPSGAQAVASYLNRLFVGGGSVPGTVSPFLGNVLFWSDLGGPTAGTLAEWQDDTSGLVNRITIGDTQSITALAAVGRQLLVFKANSIWTVLGDTPSTFTVRQLTSSTGGSNPVLVLDNNACVFNGTSGLTLFDGTDVKIIGGEQPPLSPPINITDLVDLRNDYVLIASDNGTYMLHLATGAWSTVTTDPAVWTAAPGSTAGNAIWLPRTMSGRFVYDGVSLWSAPSTDSFAAPTIFKTSSDEKQDGTGSEPIPARLVTRLARLSLPQLKSKVSRLMLDHKLMTEFVPTGLSWSVTVRNGEGTIVMPTFTVDGTQVVMDSNNFPPLDPAYARDVRDVYSETEDLYVDITLNATPTITDAIAELHDVWIDYETAQKQKSSF